MRIDADHEWVCDTCKGAARAPRLPRHWFARRSTDVLGTREVWQHYCSTMCAAESQLPE